MKWAKQWIWGWYFLWNPKGHRKIQAQLSLAPRTPRTKKQWSQGMAPAQTWGLLACRENGAFPEEPREDCSCAARLFLRPTALCTPCNQPPHDPFSSAPRHRQKPLGDREFGGKKSPSRKSKNLSERGQENKTKYLAHCYGLNCVTHPDSQFIC